MKKVSIQTRTIAVLVFIVAFSFTVTCHSIQKQQINISHYEFGKIIINGTSYTEDIEIWMNGDIKAGPEDMHRLHLSDFEELFNSGLKKLVIGTGDEGAAEYDFKSKVDKELKRRGIEVIMMTTHDLVKFLNNTPKRDFLVLVHLNC